MEPAINIHCYKGSLQGREAEIKYHEEDSKKYPGYETGMVNCPKDSCGQCILDEDKNLCTALQKEMAEKIQRG